MNVDGGFDINEVDDGGVVICVPLLTKLAGFVPTTGENGNGDSVEEGECDNGVLLSDILFVGRRIDEEGRGIGTPWIACGGCVTDVLGDDRLDTDRRCVGCEYGSAEDRPTRLSTDKPSLILKGYGQIKTTQFKSPCSPVSYVQGVPHDTLHLIAILAHNLFLCQLGGCAIAHFPVSWLPA